MDSRWRPRVRRVTGCVTQPGPWSNRAVTTRPAHAALAALGAATLWGTTGTAQALGPQGTDPTSVGAARVGLGAVVLVLLALVHRRRRPGGPDRPAALLGATGVAGGPVGRVPGPVVLVVGGLAVAAYQAFFFLGVARAGVAVGTVVALGVAPLATGLLGTGLGERPTARWLVATVGAVGGIGLLVSGSAPGGGDVDLVGLGAALGAGVSYAVYTVAARALLVRGADGRSVVAGFFTIAAVLLAPALALGDLGWLATGAGALMVLWLGVAATGVSYVLFQQGLAGLPAGTVATLSLAEPVTATLLGVLLLREDVTGLTAVGILVVLGSLSVMAVRRRTPG